MNEVTVLVGLIGVAIAILTYFAGQKKTSTEDAAKRARFEGEISAKIDILIDRFDKLEEKLTNSTSDLYDEISAKIKEHEARYHNNAS